MIRFEGNLKIDDEDFDQHYRQHQVDHDDYVKMTKQWRQHKGFCYAWKFTLVEVFAVPLWIPRKQEQGAWVNFQLAHAIAAMDIHEYNAKKYTSARQSTLFSTDTISGGDSHGLGGNTSAATATATSAPSIPPILSSSPPWDQADEEWLNGPEAADILLQLEAQLDGDNGDATTGNDDNGNTDTNRASGHGVTSASSYDHGTNANIENIPSAECGEAAEALDVDADADAPVHGVTSASSYDHGATENIPSAECGEAAEALDVDADADARGKGETANAHQTQDIDKVTLGTPEQYQCQCLAIVTLEQSKLQKSASSSALIDFVKIIDKNLSPPAVKPGVCQTSGQFRIDDLVTVETRPRNQPASVCKASGEDAEFGRRTDICGQAAQSSMDSDSATIPTTSAVSGDDYRQTQVSGNLGGTVPMPPLKQRKGRKFVESLDECMMFWEDCIYELDDEELHRLVSSLKEDTMSTAFSGEIHFALFVCVFCQ